MTRHQLQLPGAGSYDHARFGRVIQELSAHYAKALTPARIDSFWRAMRDIPIDVLEESVEWVMKSCDQLPIPSKWRRVIDRMLSAQPEELARALPPSPADGRESQGAWCDACDDTGYAVGTTTTPFGEYQCVRPCGCRPQNPNYQHKIRLAQRRSIYGHRQP
jgi:hypothetical protein